MYIQITTKCNMSCAHCCFAATKHGEHMPINVFQKALQVAVRMGDHVTIGGGEPTMHPDFKKYLNLARERCSGDRWAFAIDDTGTRMPL